jgi:2-dehydro-3-deoxyphosphogluconate aldolase/(4S)-4-hydroxy-2-oxoglutarate aldolase
MERLREGGVVPVVRTATAADAARVVEWLRDGGLRVFEITLTVPDALAVIGELARDGDLLVGAGTVLDAAAARECIDAGAQFLVSPAVTPDVARVARAASLPCLLGAATPTEVLAAMEAGAAAVKIFPVSSLGGPAHVKALRSVFPRARFCPTGGIGIGDIGDYLTAGSDFVGVGGKLVDSAAIARGDREAVVNAAHAAQAQVTAART